MSKWTRERHEEVALLCDTITQGPWQVETMVHPPNELAYKEFGPGEEPFTEYMVFTQWDHPQLKGPLPVIGTSFSPYYGKETRFIYMKKETAEFVVAAQQALPDALAEIKRLEEELEAEREQYDQSTKEYEDLIDLERELADGAREDLRVARGHIDQGRLLVEAGSLPAHKALEFASAAVKAHPECTVQIKSEFYAGLGEHLCSVRAWGPAEEGENNE